MVHLNSRNSIAFRGEVNDESIAKLETSVAALVKERGHSAYPIYIVLDSPGGDVGSGSDFIEFARSIPNLHTISVFAASMAAGMVEGIEGRRLILRNGTLMFHRAKVGLQGQVGEGEFESRLAYIKRQLEDMELQNASRMLMTLAEYKQKIKDELWLYGPDAVISHAADKTVDLVCSQELIDQRSTEVQCSLFGCAEIKFSGCPLFRAPVSIKVQ